MFVNFYLLEDEDDIELLHTPAGAVGARSVARLAAKTAAGVSAEQVGTLAKQFASALCDGGQQHGMADVQGHLLVFRTDPREAVSELFKRGLVKHVGAAKPPRAPSSGTEAPSEGDEEQRGGAATAVTTAQIQLQQIRSQYADTEVDERGDDGDGDGDGGGGGGDAQDPVAAAVAAAEYFTAAAAAAERFAAAAAQLPGARGGLPPGLLRASSAMPAYGGGIRVGLRPAASEEYYQLPGVAGGTIRWEQQHNGGGDDRHQHLRFRPHRSQAADAASYGAAGGGGSRQAVGQAAHAAPARPSARAVSAPTPGGGYL